MDKLIVLATQAAILRISVDMINHHIVVAVMLLMIVIGDYLASKYVIGRMLKEVRHHRNAAAPNAPADKLHP